MVLSLELIKFETKCLTSSLAVLLDICNPFTLTSSFLVGSMYTTVSTFEIGMSGNGCIAAFRKRIIISGCNSSCIRSFSKSTELRKKSNRAKRPRTKDAG